MQPYGEKKSLRKRIHIPAVFVNFSEFGGDSSDTITQVADPLVRVTNGSATSVVFIDDKNGVGYNHIPQLMEQHK